MSLSDIVKAGFAFSALLSACYFATPAASQDIRPPVRASAPAPREHFTLSREEFYEFGRRPIRESLSDVVEFVSEAEYDGAVNQQSESPKKPVISLIFCDDAIATEISPSRGLAAIVYTLDRRYDNIKFVAYQASHHRRPSQDEFENPIQRFSTRTLPALITYAVRNGRLSMLDQMNGGVDTYEPNSNGRGGYLRNLQLISEAIDTRLLQ